MFGIYIIMVIIYYSFSDYIVNFIHLCFSYSVGFFYLLSQYMSLIHPQLYHTYNCSSYYVSITFTVILRILSHASSFGSSIFWIHYLLIPCSSLVEHIFSRSTFSQKRIHWRGEVFEYFVVVIV